MSKINPFAINAVTGSPAMPFAQYATHTSELNRPCNCDECLIHALALGVIKVTLAEHPETGEEVWVPELTDDETAISIVSADGVRKVFTPGDIPGLAHLMIANKWCAPRKELLPPLYSPSDKKRKPSPADKPAKKPRKSNSAMSASSMMPIGCTCGAAAECTCGNGVATDEDELVIE